MLTAVDGLPASVEVKELWILAIGVLASRQWSGRGCRSTPGLRSRPTPRWTGSEIPTRLWYTRSRLRERSPIGRRRPTRRLSWCTGSYEKVRHGVDDLLDDGDRFGGGVVV